MKVIPRAIAHYILDANEDTDLYCIVPKSNVEGMPVAADYRVMSGCISMDVYLMQHENQPKIWEFALHFNDIAMIDHKQIHVFLAAEDRDVYLAAEFERWKQECIANANTMARLNDIMHNKP